MIGSTLGDLWHKAGHTVLFSSRHPERLEDLVTRLGKGAYCGTPREAASFGEVILLSVPYRELPVIVKDLYNELLGKTTIETGNPYPERDGDMAEKVLTSGKGTGFCSRQFLPGTNVVRAFNTIYYKTLASEAHRDGEKVAVPIAGETDVSAELAASLVRDAGFEPVLVGGLDTARFFDVGTRVYNRAMTAAELRSALDLESPTRIDFLKGIPKIS
jgi:hypothetical protein